MTNSIKIGALTFNGELAAGGGHVLVTVRGSGIEGQRPLCGSLMVTPEDWESLCVASRSASATPDSLVVSPP